MKKYKIEIKWAFIFAVMFSAMDDNGKADRLTRQVFGTAAVCYYACSHSFHYYICACHKGQEKKLLFRKI